MKLTKHKLSIISLALIFVMALTAFFGLHFIKADASGTVTVSGTNVFTSSGVGATVTSYTKEGETPEYYTMFSITDDEQNISYRRNLAYKWFEGYTEGEGDEAVSKHRAGFFNMQIGFADTSFEKFVITFESQVYNKIKESKSTNYIMFFPAEEGKVYVHITNEKDDTVENIPADAKTALDADEITIEFSGRNGDKYNVSVYSDEASRYEGYFENVGGNYAKSSTSSTNPVYPLIFGAEFAEDKEDAKAEMVLYSLNGQDFKVSSSSSLTVADSQPPVLCLEEDIRYFTPGSALDIDYTVIDVLRSSPSSTVHYYLLTYSDKEEGVKDFKYTEPEDDFRLDSDENKYLPEEDDVADTVFTAYNDKDGKFTADMLISVYITLTDISTNSETCDVYLDWYVEEDADNKYLVNINDTDFIVVANDKEGVRFNNNNFDWPTIKEEYQKRVDEAAKDLSAGSSSYIYLPSAESLFIEQGTSYTDMKLSIYYYHDSQSSSTNLDTNNLSLNVSRQGSYIFTFYATDKAGNKMLNIRGEEFGSDEIWDMFEDGDDTLPWFRFDVGYTGVSFEETPGMQSTAYVGTAYSGASFKINGVTDSYDTVYRLFRFDSARYYAENDNKSFTYEEFIANMDELFEGAETRKYFYEILPVDGLEETDEEYEEFADYQWSSTYTSFTPQVAGLYYIRAEVTDKLYNSEPVTCSLAVVASEKATPLKGESDWLKNNIASVVLLCVAGLALIGIILLLVIKPKDKGDIDVQFEEKANKKKNK